MTSCELSKRERPLFVAVLVAIIGSITATAAATAEALATPISSSKDWRLMDLGTSCVAETVTAVDGVIYSLQLKVERAPSSPLEIFIQTDRSASGATGFKTTIDRAKAKTYSFTKLSGFGTGDSFWNIPRGSDELVSYLKRELKLDVQGYDAAGLPLKVVSFSLRGSTSTITDLGKKCAAGLAVPTPADMAFEKAFLPQAVASVDLGRVTPAKADTLRATLQQARNAFLTSRTVQGEIEALNAKYLKEINELAGLRSNLDRLTQNEIKRLENARVIAQNAIAASEADLASLRPQTAIIESDLVTANTEYEAAYNAVKPLLPEYNRLAGAIRTAEGRVSAAQSEVASVEASLRTANDTLSRLRAESSQLRSRYSAVQSDARAARDELQRAARESNNFDVASEVRNRVTSDRQLSRLQDEIRDAETRIDAQERAAKGKELERNRYNEALLRCQQEAGKDCSKERRNLTDAQREFQELGRGIEVLERARDQKRAQLQDRRRDISEEVTQIKRQLENREAQARNRVQDTEIALRNMEDRIRAIDQIEIPGQETRVRSLTSDLRLANDEALAAGSRLRSAQTELSNYRQSTGFDALQAQVDVKLTRVNSLKSSLANVDREIKKREKTIADSQKSLAQTAIEMDKVLAQIRQKEARSVEVQKALEPYDLAKTEMAHRKAASDQAFATAQAEFAQNL